ncbi:all development altered-6 [Fusarium austroafricanum]|uniref:All development altered-6 n=1 Tax=Fusarium austroafricanum TaxID=2364996 RepID=A0A8H4KN69_9HYPO|nr:all development altered-6 [Fusarium austroafricanum]
MNAVVANPNVIAVGPTIPTNIQVEGTISEVDDGDELIQADENLTLETASWLNDLATTWEHCPNRLLAMDKTSPDCTDPMTSPENLNLSDMMQADLDTLYFDRIYAFAPIIHRGRYFSWANQENPSSAQTCLRLAMWTLASAVSTQFHNLKDKLHAVTLQSLQRADSHQRNIPWATGNIELEEIQAWLLIAYYEFIREERHHVLVTATHAFRLVQQARLHTNGPVLGAEKGKDSFPSCPFGSGGNTNVSLEEKRRTFWLAFWLDRMLKARYDLMFTIQEEVIDVYLPTTELSFQTSQLHRDTHLTEAIVISERKSTSSCSFAENVVQMALYGRCMTHRRLAMLVLSGRRVSEKNSKEFWNRHSWLESAVEKFIQPLSDIALDPWDPMTTFGHMLSRSAIIHLSETAATWTWQMAEHQSMAAKIEEKGYQAAMELANLTARLPRASYLKASSSISTHFARAYHHFPEEVYGSTQWRALD